MVSKVIDSVSYFTRACYQPPEVLHVILQLLLTQPLQINEELMRWSKDQFPPFIPRWQGNYRSQKITKQKSKRKRKKRKRKKKKKKKKRKRKKKEEERKREREAR